MKKIEFMLDDGNVSLVKTKTGYYLTVSAFNTSDELNFIFDQKIANRVINFLTEKKSNIKTNPDKLKKGDILVG